MALVAALQRQVAALSAANDALRTEIVRLTRAGKRQSAPLAKGSRVAQPKRPGRKPGSGTFHYRAVPRLHRSPSPQWMSRCGWLRVLPVGDRCQRSASTARIRLISLPALARKCRSTEWRCAGV